MILIALIGAPHVLHHCMHFLGRERGLADRHALTECHCSRGRRVTESGFAALRSLAMARMGSRQEVTNAWEADCRRRQWAHPLMRLTHAAALKAADWPKCSRRAAALMVAPIEALSCRMHGQQVPTCQGTERHLHATAVGRKGRRVGACAGTKRQHARAETLPRRRCQTCSGGVPRAGGKHAGRIVLMPSIGILHAAHLHPTVEDACALQNQAVTRQSQQVSRKAGRSQSQSLSERQEGWV
jgi:hypothetical protein